MGQLPIAGTPSADAESCDWLRALSGSAADSEAAAERLHGLLLRAARFEIVRRQRARGTGSGPGQLDNLAMHAADDALTAILRKLGDLPR